jgi:hypothetical protein
MALSSTVQFVGKQSFDFFSSALFDNSVLSEFQIYDGQQNTIQIPRITLAGHTVADSCDFGATGSIGLSPATLSVCKFKINERVCRSEVEPTFLSQNLQNGSFGEVAPGDFASYVLNDLAGIIGNNMQNVLWNGDTENGALAPYLQLCDGILTTATASGSIRVTATSSAITPANVEGELARVYLTMPSNVKSSGKAWKIYVSQDVADAYVIQQGNLAFGLNSTTSKELRYAGIPLVVAPFMPAKTMFATAPDNIAIGADLTGDWSEVRVIDTLETLGENAWRIVARWKFGVVIKIGAETVIYI